MAADHALRRELSRRIRDDLIQLGIVAAGPAVRIADGAQGANRGAEGVRGTPLPFLPAWRSSAPSDFLARYQDFSNSD
jgi:hypothetical protein